MTTAATEAQPTAPNTYANVYMPMDIKKRLKIRAAIDDTDMSAWACRAIVAALDAADAALKS